MGKVNMQEEVDNISRKLEILRKNPKEILELKTIITEMNNIFDGLISRVDIAEERIPELEKIKIETSKTVKQREKRLKKIQNRIFKDLNFTASGINFNFLKDFIYSFLERGRDTLMSERNMDAFPLAHTLTTY